MVRRTSWYARLVVRFVVRFACAGVSASTDCPLLTALQAHELLKQVEFGRSLGRHAGVVAAFG